MRELDMRITSLHLALLAALAGCAPSASAEPGGASGSSARAVAEPAEEAVKSALAGVEWDPDQTASVLREPDADEVLMRLAAGRPGDPQVVRVRAIMALRHHPTEETWRFLVAAIESDPSPDVVAAGLETLGAAFDSTRAHEVLAVAKARVDDADPGVRRAAREAAARARLARWTSP
jgi:hypothetical protein